MTKLTLPLFLIPLLLLLACPAGAQSESPVPPTPPPEVQRALEEAQAVRARADEVLTTAQEAAAQATATLDLIKTLITLFGVLIAIATALLALYGWDTRRGFRDLQKAYDEKLQQAEATLAAVTQKAAEIETIRQELAGLKDEVRREFEVARQALVLLALGNRLFDEGKVAQAIDVYQEARRLSPDDAEINYRLGRAYSNRAQFAEAIEMLEQAINVRPDHPEANMELGLAYRRHAERAPSAEERKALYRLAERYLRRALKLRPDYEDALGALGGLYRREGRYQEAVNAYERAATVDPNSSYALNNLAVLHWYLGHTDRARYYFERVEEVATERLKAGRPLSFWDLYDRALARLVLGRYEKAKADHEQAVAQTPEVQNFESVLDVLYLLQSAPQPIEHLDEFIEMIERRMPEGK